VSDSRMQALTPAAQMAPTEHPLGNTWVCGECEASGLRLGACCHVCNTVLCAGCAGKQHRIPTGQRAGLPCEVREDR